MKTIVFAVVRERSQSEGRPAYVMLAPADTIPGEHVHGGHVGLLEGVLTVKLTDPAAVMGLVPGHTVRVTLEVVHPAPKAEG